MSKRPPHGGKPPNGGKPPGATRRPMPKKRDAKREPLIIHDIDDALRRIWQRPKPTKR